MVRRESPVGSRGPITSPHANLRQSVNGVLRNDLECRCKEKGKDRHLSFCPFFKKNPVAAKPTVTIPRTPKRNTSDERSRSTAVFALDHIGNSDSRIASVEVLCVLRDEDAAFAIGTGKDNGVRQAEAELLSEIDRTPRDFRRQFDTAHRFATVSRQRTVQHLSRRRS